MLEGTAPGAPLFPSPGRRVRTADGTTTRIDRGLNPYNNWRERIWTPIAEATEAWPEGDDRWPPHRGPAPDGMQSQRRWLWPVHSLPHVCATYQLNALGLDPDDVAKFLGHRSGVGCVGPRPLGPVRPRRRRQPRRWRPPQVNR